LTELRVDDRDELIELVTDWAAGGGGENPARRVIDDAARSAVDALGRQDAQLSARRDAFTATAAELTTEIGRLEAGGHDRPPPPHTRDPQVRDIRPGAPLWKVTDFAPGVPEHHRAGLEAALEAAGILDAWLTPDGDLVAGDVVLVSGRHPVTGPSCDAVLVPAVNGGDRQAVALPEAAVWAALSAIGLGEGTGTTWVTVDGRWANGVLAGRWHKGSAEYVGEGARETARRERIARLTAELAEANDAIAALDQARDELGRRQDQLATEHRAVPPDAEVREAHTRTAEQRKRRQELRTSHAAAEALRGTRREQLEVAQSAADEFAGDTGLPAEPGELAAVRTGLADYRVALAALWPAAEAFQSARSRADEAAEELAETQERLTEAAERAVATRQAATAARALYEELLETAGAAVEELNRKLEELRGATERRDADEAAARQLEQQAISDRGKAEGKRETLRTEIGEAARVRDAAVAEFQSFAATGVLGIALPDLAIPDPAEPWLPTPTVVLARAVNSAMDDIDDADGPWDRVQRKVNEEHKLLADAMARRSHSAGLTVRDGIMVIDVVFQGRSHDIPGLAAALSEEVEQRARLLSAREQEILENHLLNEVAGTLHELITAAEAEVRQMNEELESRPTSTGMKLRLIWRPARDAPDGLDRLRHKLRQMIDAWSADDRAAVGAFLQQRIAAEHAANEAAGWTEALTTALDYRKWHEFVIQRYQDGQWRPASGPASGGERALVASVPLFAAASAHYKSAGNPYAPRLIALDEAFAGVDDDSRAKCLGLLATFDMDVVMTSEREWGCYPQVPGLAICQLSRQDGVDAVLVTPWQWDGRERTPASTSASTSTSTPAFTPA
ncbi:MAG: TIGR02680 family protein, partial [Streptosporangiaceae bacterium]